MIWCDGSFSCTNYQQNSELYKFNLRTQLNATDGTDMNFYLIWVCVCAYISSTFQVNLLILHTFTFLCRRLHFIGKLCVILYFYAKHMRIYLVNLFFYFTFALINRLRTFLCKVVYLDNTFGSMCTFYDSTSTKCTHIHTCLMAH